MDRARLITIPISHFCEKARWVLDAAGIGYREEPHAPVAHLRATRAVGGASVPVLVHGGRVLRDSTDIALYVDTLAAPERRLVPAEAEARARVLAIEDELDETIGIDARLLVYWYYLREDNRARAFVARMMGLRSALAQRIVAPLFRALIFRKYKVSDRAARLAEARVRENLRPAWRAHRRAGLSGRRPLHAGRPHACRSFCPAARPAGAPNPGSRTPKWRAARARGASRRAVGHPRRTPRPARLPRAPRLEQRPGRALDQPPSGMPRFGNGLPPEAGAQYWVIGPAPQVPPPRHSAVEEQSW